MTVATGVTTNSEPCGDQPTTTIVTLMTTSGFDCSTDRIEAPAGQVIFDAYIATAYAQNTVVTGSSFAFRIRSNGSTGTVSAQLFYVNTAGTKTFIGSAVNSSSISSEANVTINLSSQSATVPAGSKLGFRLKSNGPEFRLFWGSSWGTNGATLVVTEASTSATTTLGTGTDPGHTSLAPGGAATFADALTFQTSSGTDTITALTVGFSAGSVAGLGLVELTNDAGTTVYGSVTNPSTDSPSIALASTITATTTSTQYRIRVTPKSHAAMPAPAGSVYNVTAAVTSWTGTNGQAGSDTAGTTITIDNLSPSNVSGGSVTAKSTVVALTWAGPTDADLAAVVVLRRAGGAVADVPTEGTSYAVGDAVGSSFVVCVVAPSSSTCSDTALTNGTSYHYKIFTKDASGNYSTGVVPVGSPSTPFAGVTVSPMSSLTTSEAGGTATFTVVLTSQPTHDVTVALTSSDTTEGTVLPSSLVFTTSNWGSPQTGTVTGVDDRLVDGSVGYTIVIGTATSTDAGYSGYDPVDVSVANTDNDSAGVVTSLPGALVTTEAGGTATFTLVLSAEPSHDVVIPLSSSDSTEATVSPPSVTFASANWNTPRTVTVTGVDDEIADGTIAYTVVIGPASSADNAFHGHDPGDLGFTNTDNDTAGIAVSPTSGLVTTEAGGTATFTVVLTSQPTDTVTIGLVSSDATEGNVSPTTLTFTTTNWATAQTATVTGVDDGLVDGTVTYSIVTGASSPADASYHGLAVADVSISNTDNDVPQADLRVSKSNGVHSVTAGGSATYTIVVANAGPSAVVGATVSDAAPPGSAFGAWTCVASSGSSCPASGAGDIAATIDLQPAGSATFTVPVAFSSAASGTITNTATVVLPSGVVDPTPGNNSASDSDTVSPPVAPTADLSVTKSDGMTSVSPNATTTYTIVVTNAGPGAAHGAIVTDAATTGLTKTSVSCVALAGALCPTGPSVAELEAGLPIPTLPAGGTLTVTVAATVTAVGGTITNTATVAAPSGIIDPALGNNSAVDTNGVGSTVDLSITKSNGSSTVTTGAPTVYTLVVSNAGPSPADGAIVSDPPANGLTKAAVSCVASGGAACPSNPTVSQLESGIVVPTLPSGGRVTFTLTTAVTATSGRVVNTATVAPPAGTSDPNGANQTASDTDAVAGAGTRSDLVVTLTSDSTDVAPGQTFTYTIRVTNLGPDAAAGVTLVNGAPAGLAFGRWTCVGSGGATCPGSGSGDINAVLGVPVGGTVVFTIPATIGPNAPASIVSVATITLPTGSSDPVVQNNAATAVTRMAPQRVAVSIRGGTPSVVGPATFDVPFTIDVTNAGSATLTNLQVLDPLSSAFSSGQPEVTVTRITVPSGPCARNSGFTGVGSGTSSSIGLLTGSGSLGAGQTCTIELSARVTYPSAAAIPSSDQVNRIVARTTSMPGDGTELARAQAEARVRLVLPRVDVTKAITDVRQHGDEPMFDISYAFVLRNTSEAEAPNVQLVDNLAETFRPGSPTISIADGPRFDHPEGVLTIATASPFNGTSATAILTGTDTMPPGAERRIVLTVRVRYSHGAAVPAGVDLDNLATATTSVTPGGIVITSDQSTDVTRSGAEPRADDVPLPTTVRLTPRARLSIEKAADVLVAEIGDTVQYSIRVRNLGGPMLPALTIADHLPLGFRYVKGSARMAVGRAASQPIQDPAGGAASMLSFTIPEQADRDEATIHYRVRIGAGALQGDGINTAEAITGSVRSSVARARVTVSGGVFTTDACLVGKIFADRNANRVQDPGELGIPAVQLTLEEGTSLVSDVEGKYSFCGLTPSTHVLKVDRTTLPPGAQLLPAGSRHAGDGGSLFLDLRSGGVHRADFVEGSRDLHVLAEIASRRARGEVWAPSFDGPIKPSVPRRGPNDPRVASGGMTASSAGPFGTVSGERFVPVPVDPVATHRTSPAAGEPDVSADGPTTEGPGPRPLLAVGLVEGRVSLSKVTGDGLPVRPTEVFDRELTRVSRSFALGGAQGQYGARGALFAKGRMMGKTAVTFAYDTERDGRSVLFRDIQPDAFYPIYGDSSLKHFDAQSSGRFYARADRGASSLMFGDFVTAPGDRRQQLGAYGRTLTGLQHHFEHRRALVNVFASRDSLRQVIDEFGALGVSGPYVVSNPNGVSGTERVEIVTRDRNQPAVVLKVVSLARFTDYEFEPFSGRLLLRRPVPSLDERLNPQAIRVTYEVDAGGAKSWIAGGDAHVRLAPWLQLGGGWAEDARPGAPYRLRSLNATVRLGPSTSLVAEGAESIGPINPSTAAGSTTSFAGDELDGLAGRIELQHESRRLVARAFASVADAGFSNPAAPVASGRTEAGGRATFAMADGIRLVGEALHSADHVTNGQRDGGLLAVQAKIGRALALEVGLRHSTETGQPAQGTSVGLLPFGMTASADGFGVRSPSGVGQPTGTTPPRPAFSPLLSAGGSTVSAEPTDTTAVRTKLSVALGERTTLYGEGEQDARDSSKRMAAVGAEVRVTDRDRLYARHELLSSLDGPYGLTNGQQADRTVFGVASSYMREADVFSEYRMRDAMSGREAEAAIGLRNSWTLADGVRFSTGLERLHTTAGVERHTTAASVGLEYTRGAHLKGTGRFEWRRDPSGDTWLSTTGLARKLTRDWTLLAKNFYQRASLSRLPHQAQDRLSIGGAYRDTTTNRLTLLTRYELRFGNTAGTALGGVHRWVHVVSTHVDFQPARAWTLSGQHAAKRVDDRVEPRPSLFTVHLLSGRVGYDLTPRWDVGGLTSLLVGNESGRRHAVGGELGFRLFRNLWLSHGYNVAGFSDRDFVAEHHTTRGTYVRFRVKFDEEIIGSRGDTR